MQQKTQTSFSLLEVVFHVLYGMGMMLILAPGFLYWWIHGNYERYLWIIGGPAPYSKFGSGPYQLAMYGCLVIVGVFLLIAAKILQRRFYGQKD